MFEEVVRKKVQHFDYEKYFKHYNRAISFSNKNGVRI